MVEKMSPFKGEMSRRLWWCIYLLDRRLALETGRPFLIQDVNVDVGLPQQVSDEWLTRCRAMPHATAIKEAMADSCPSNVPYLIAMVTYSRVVGKVWEALYGATTSESSSSPLLNEYLEILITQSQKEIHPGFSRNSNGPTRYDPGGLPWWQVKQYLMMRIVSFSAYWRY